MILPLTVALAAPTTWEIAREHQSDHLALPSAPTRAALRDLVRTLVESAPGGTVPPQAAAAAVALDLQLRVEGDRVYLTDRDHLDRGAGLLAVRLGPLAAELVVQAPHPMTDTSTGAIVGRLFDAGEVRAVCIATNPRDLNKQADPVDLARSWLSVMTLAIADALQDPLFVQIHGFDPATTDADAVLSPGVRYTRGEEWDEAFRRVAIGLSATDVRGPEEVPNLAAHDNMQGRILARRGLRFWHLELSGALREAIRTEPSRLLALRDQLLLLAGREEDPG